MDDKRYLEPPTEEPIRSETAAPAITLQEIGAIAVAAGVIAAALTWYLNFWIFWISITGSVVGHAVRAILVRRYPEALTAPFSRGRGGWRVRFSLRTLFILTAAIAILLAQYPYVHFIETLTETSAGSGVFLVGGYYMPTFRLASVALAECAVWIGWLVWSRSARRRKLARCTASPGGPAVCPAPVRDV